MIFIIVPLLLAPFVNIVFLIRSLRTYFRVSAARPVLLALLTVDLIVWLVGAFTAVLAGMALLGPPRPMTITGLAFGIALLLIQGLPIFIDVQMRRIERGT